MKITSPLQMILYGGIGPNELNSTVTGMEKLGIGIGKTTLAAKFVKEFNGVHCEVAPIIQSMGGKGKSPVYTFDPHDRGHASYACEKVGLDMQKQYRYARTWEDFETIVENAMMNAIVDEKKRHWFIVDDSADWRTQAAYHAAKVAGRQQITKPDWMQATTDLQIQMQNLVSNFNVVYVNRNINMTKKIKDATTGEVIEQVETGSKQFYPNQADHRAEAVLRLEIKDRKRVLFIEKNTLMDIIELQPDFVIEDLTPQGILTAMKIHEKLW
jgi:hypothetical protein